MWSLSEECLFYLHEIAPFEQNTRQYFGTVIECYIFDFKTSGGRVMAFKFLSIILTLGIFVSCGKDSTTNTSGSSSSAQPYSTPVQQLANNLSSNSGQSAFNNLLSWYNSNVENSTPAITVKEQRRIDRFSQPNCKTNTYFSILNLQTCFGSTSGSVDYVERNVTASTNTIKSSVPNLAAIFQPTASMTLMGVTQWSGPFGKPMYQLDFFKSNGYFLRYQIDTGLNSAFNPVLVFDSEKGTSEIIINPYYLR